MSKQKWVPVTPTMRMEENKGERKTKYKLKTTDAGSSCQLLPF
jgi:hypothetical protein